jgi:hypothetical protein
MKKSLMIAAAGVAFALASPLAAAAAPAIPADAIHSAIKGISPVESTAWHCRPWSGWCRTMRPRPRWHRRWRSRRW